MEDMDTHTYPNRSSQLTNKKKQKIKGKLILNAISHHLQPIAICPPYPTSYLSHCRHTSSWQMVQHPDKQGLSTHADNEYTTNISTAMDGVAMVIGVAQQHVCKQTQEQKTYQSQYVVLHVISLYTFFFWFNVYSRRNVSKDATNIFGEYFGVIANKEKNKGTFVVCTSP